MHANIRAKLNIHEHGQGEPTIVLAHGFGSDQTAWRNQVAALAPRHRLVLFDYLGCGKSDVSDYNPLEYSSLDRYADDVIAMYEALALSNTVFVAHSASGLIAVLAARKRRGMFKKLAWIGASPRYLNDGDYTGGFERADLDALYSAMAADYLGWANGFAPVVMRNAGEPALGDEFARTLSEMRPDIAQSVARVIFETDIRALLPEIDIPVLLLQAKIDIAVPLSVGRYLAAQIPQCRLIELDAEGHLPHLSAPDQVTAALRGFIDDESL
jgi:sigma-B regulation protein RsbQ